jgi:hypothetical protein
METPITTQRRIMPRAHLAQVLRRAGYPATRAKAVLCDLPDPIDFDRDGQILFKRGVSLGRLTDARGGSP